eukprot:scaffold58312_cov36-Tisochrysis_lutea.AAC.2
MEDCIICFLRGVQSIALAEQTSPGRVGYPILSAHCSGVGRRDFTLTLTVSKGSTSSTAAREHASSSTPTVALRSPGTRTRMCGGVLGCASAQKMRDVYRSNACSSSSTQQPPTCEKSGLSARRTSAAADLPSETCCVGRGHTNSASAGLKAGSPIVG